MKILLINNNGAGFADFVEIAEDTTVQKLFAERIPYGRVQDFPCDSNFLLVKKNCQFSNSLPPAEPLRCGGLGDRRGLRTSLFLEKTRQSPAWPSSHSAYRTRRALRFCPSSAGAMP